MGTKIVSWFTSKNNSWCDGLFNDGIIIDFIFHLIKHNCIS